MGADRNSYQIIQLIGAAELICIAMATSIRWMRIQNGQIFGGFRLPNICSVKTEDYMALKRATISFNCLESSMSCWTLTLT